MLLKHFQKRKEKSKAVFTSSLTIKEYAIPERPALATRPEKYIKTLVNLLFNSTKKQLN